MHVRGTCERGVPRGLDSTQLAGSSAAPHWRESQGWIPGGLDFRGGAPLACRPGRPPSNPQPSLRAAAQHLMGCTTFASSHPASKSRNPRVFARSVKRDLARLGNREIATVLERGAGLITTLGDLGVVSCGIVRQVFAVATTLPKNHLPHMKGCARQIAGP
jgi:hypothetical protein